FFFSSRRRHTRFSRDWSSDVCSSDLTLKNLEERGLIARKPNPDDGRSILIVLTEEGLKMRNVSKEVVLKFNEAINERISTEEMQVFLNVIEKINAITSDKSIYDKNKESDKRHQMQDVGL